MKNDYYVYLHKTLNGEVFYVGKGRLKRAWSKSNRGKNWRSEQIRLLNEQGAGYTERHGT